MISIIHPSRGRPKKASNTFGHWFNFAEDPDSFEWILSLDSDDDSIPSYYEKFGNNFCYPDVIIQNDNRSAIDAINRAATYTKGDIIMVVSDDTLPCERWDMELLKWLQGKSDFIIKTQDGTQPWIITNPILDRAYYNRFGYIYHPDYQHMFCDTELTCVADLTGRKLTSNILFKHNHYSVTKEQRDAVSIKADSTWDQGEKLFLERYKRNFDLPPDQIKGKIQDNGMINWLKRKIR